MKQKIEFHVIAENSEEDAAIINTAEGMLDDTSEQIDDAPIQDSEENEDALMQDIPRSDALVQGVGGVVYEDPLMPGMMLENNWVLSRAQLCLTVVFRIRTLIQPNHLSLPMSWVVL